MALRRLLYIILCCISSHSAQQTISRKTLAPPQSLLDLEQLGDATSCSRSCLPCLNRISTYNITRKFFFLHVPKTGGLSVEMDIRNIVCNGKFLTKNACFCGRNKSQFDNLASNSFRYKGSMSTYGWRDFDVFSGHQNWGMVDKFAEEAKPVTATVLRDPIARAISHWNMVAGRSFGFDNKDNVTFSEAVRSSWARFGSQTTLGHSYGSAIRNEQVKFLCGVNCRDSLPISEALETAKRNLLRTAIVGIQEDMDGFLEQFRAVLPWWPSRKRFKHFSRLNSAREKKNIFRRRKHRHSTLGEMDTVALELLQKFLAPEFELYDLAKKLAHAKSSWAYECKAYALSQSCNGFISDCF